MRRLITYFLALLILGVLTFATATIVPERLLAEDSIAAAISEREPGNDQMLGVRNNKLRRQKWAEVFLNRHRDQSGKVRSDLWRKGIADVKKMKITAAGLQPAGGIAAAGAGGVSGVQWTQIGPQPLRIDAEQNFQGSGPDSGEVVDVAIDPRNATDQTVYIAVDNGGIWKTTDGGSSWKPKTDFMPSLSMGAVALDPGNPSIVYAGTGNLFDPAITFFNGIGIYRSIDSGETWTVLNPNGIFTNLGINRIRMPAPGVLLVATGTPGRCMSDPTAGLFRSVDGGLNFGANSPNFNDGNPILTGCISDLDLDTANPNTVYASVWGQGIMQSTDGGATFPTDLFNNPGAPAAPFRFIRFAQGTTDSTRMYASVGGSVTNYNGLYRSDNSGANWAKQNAADAAGADNGGCPCGFAHTLGVDPQDEDRVYLGFQELYLSIDGGGSFGIAPPISRNKTHWDHHALVYSPQTHWGGGGAPTRFWVGTDGGVASTSDGGTTFANLNETIATNLFNDLAIGIGTAANNDYSYGGTQDTGTIERRPEFAGNDWHLGIDGDGAGVAVDPINPLRAYGAANGGYIVTSDGGNNWDRSSNGWNGNVATPPPSVWRYAIDPNDGNNIFLGTTATGATGFFNPGNQVWRSTDQGANFSAINTFPSNVQTIANTPTDSSLVWVGLTNGNLQRTSDALAATPAWTAINVPGSLNQAVTGIAINPLNTDQVAVVYQGFCGGACGTGIRTRHVFWTSDNGVTWTDISGTDGGNGADNLPDLPLHSVVIDPDTFPPAIIVASDAAVMRSVNLGMTWQILGVGFPTVDSIKLVLDPSATPSLLRVGTYGRSVFELTAPTGPLLAINADLGFDAVCVGDDATRIVQLFNVGSEDLHITSFVRLSGSTDFDIISGPATPVTIKPGEEIDYTIRFAPSSGGDKTAIFQINSNDQFQPATQLPASGRGVTPAIVTIMDTDYGDVCLGDAKTQPLTILNDGACDLTINSILIIDADSEFDLATVMSTPFTLKSGESVSADIEFTPMGDVGGAGGQVAISHNATSSVSPQVLNLSGNSPSAAISTFIANSGSFGEVCAGDFVDLNLTVQNNGACPLEIDSASIVLGANAQAGDFVQSTGSAAGSVVGPANSVQIPIRFLPSAFDNEPPAIRMASVEVDSHTKFASSTLATDVTPIDGVVPPPDINVAIANSGDFGDVCKTDHADLDLTLFNQGKCDLTISDIALLPNAGSFELPANLQLPLLLSPDADFPLPIRFSPDVCFDTPENRTIKITSDDPDELMVNVAISGTSPCPNLVIDPASLSDLFAFPATVVDTTGTLGCYSERSVNLRNTGECPLTITSIVAEGVSGDIADFTVTDPTVLPKIILPTGEETLAVTVRFTPQADADPLAPNEVTGLLKVVSDDPDTPHTADVCGESITSSGVRILVTDVSTGSPVIVGEVDSIVIQSKGKNRPGPINIQLIDVTPSSNLVCGNRINYHVDQETLPSTSTTGNNPKSSYIAKAKVGNLQTSESFGLGQCEFRDFQLELQSSETDPPGACVLKPKGAACESASECCSFKCKGKTGLKTCK